MTEADKKQKEIRQAVREKLDLIKDFGIITGAVQKKVIEDELWTAIKNHPHSNYELVLDNVSKDIIKRYLDKIEEEKR